MQNLEMKNFKMVKEEIYDLNKIFYSINDSKDKDILSIGFFYYFIILEMEALNYIEHNTDIKIKEKLIYKKKLENCRARIKPLEGNSQSIYNSYEKMNMNEMKRYTKDLDLEKIGIFKSLITNLGIYKINRQVILNTFEANKIYKEIIFTEGDYDTNKVYETSKEIGQILAYLNNIFGINRNIRKENINYEIYLEDYDVLRKNTILFNNKIDRNIALMLLDELCMINFYRNIIKSFHIKDSTKYRMAYITFNRTYNNIKKYVQINKELKLNVWMYKIEDIISKYNYLNENNFRNCIFHYDLNNDLEDKEIKDELYFGVISKYLNISEKTFKYSLNNYFNIMSRVLTNLIMKHI